MHTEILTPVTLTLNLGPAFRFRNLHLGFEKCSQFLYPSSYFFHIPYACIYGQHLSMHTKSLTPVTLTLNLGPAFRFQNLRLGFEYCSYFLHLLRYCFHICMNVHRDKTFPCGELCCPLATLVYNAFPPRTQRRHLLIVLESLMYGLV